MIHEITPTKSFQMTNEKCQIMSNEKWKMNLPDHVLIEYQGPLDSGRGSGPSHGLFVAVVTALICGPAPLSRSAGAG